ncbi:MAG: ABC transporter substrate-binding protein [Eubacteriales bacterium]|nr:ABC transporter substrate-binding protein [Eubacteriales bacterium]
MKKKIMAILMIIVCVAANCTGCGPWNDSSSDGLKVYYCETAKSKKYEKILDMFKQINSDVQCEFVKFNSEEELNEKVALDMAGKNGPDVILLSSESQMDIDKAVSGGKLKDMKEYLNSDNSLKDDNYLMNVINACVVDGKQYVVPFNFDVNLFYYQDIEKDVFSDVDEKTVSYSEFIEYLDKCYDEMYTEDEEYITMTSVRAFFSQNLSLLTTMMTDMGIELIDGNEIIISEDELKMLCSLVKKIYDENKLKYNHFKSNMSISEVHQHIKTFTMNYEDAVSISILNYYIKEGGLDKLKFVSIPSNKGNGKTAFITDYGVVSSKCKNPDKAYRLLKYIMDSKNDYSDRYYMSVNRDIFEQKITALSGTTDWIMSSGKVYQLEKWDAGTKEKFEDIIGNIQYAYIRNNHIEEIFSDSMQKYVDGSCDFDRCYEELMNKLTLYLRE